MNKIFFLEYAQDDFGFLKDSISHNVKETECISVTGRNIDVKEFIRVKLRGIEDIDYFLLDVRALQNTDYTSILLFKASIIEKYPGLIEFLVIARSSEGLSNEEYNDIIRNSVGGKNYKVFNDSDNSNLSDEIIAYIKNGKDKETKNKVVIKADAIVREKSKISDDDSLATTKRKGVKAEETPIELIEGSKDALGTYERHINNEQMSGEKKPHRLNAGDLMVAESKSQYGGISNIGDYDKKLEWHNNDDIVLFFGAGPAVGTSFVAMSLAIELGNSGAKVSYVQFDPISDIDEKAKDYGFLYNGSEYVYKNVVFTKNKFIEGMNCHIVDIGTNYKYLLRAIELGWLNRGKLIIVSAGNHQGLKKLYEIIDDILSYAIDSKIMIVNPILSKDSYSAYEAGKLFFFEHMKRIDDRENRYVLSLLSGEINKEFNSI